METSPLRLTPGGGGGNLQCELWLRFGRKGRGRGNFLNPQAIAALPDGRLAVSDSSAQNVQVEISGQVQHDLTRLRRQMFTRRGVFVSGMDRGDGLRRPVGIVATGSGRLAVADYDAASIAIFELGATSAKLLARFFPCFIPSSER